MRSPLWVTGLGLVTPLGLDVESTWSRLVRGDRAIVPITRFDASNQRVGIAAEVKGIALPAGPGDVRASWSRTSVMAATAAGEAMRMARLTPRASRVGLVVGGTTGGMFETEGLLARLHAEPACREVLLDMLSHPLTATGDRLHEKLGPFCRVRSLSSACSSGSNAIVVAAAWLLSAEVDAVVAGGSDGLCRLTLSGFNALGAIDPDPCRPFDRRRRGTSLGEGAGFVVLERAADARARGVEPVSELAGWAVGSEAHHITHPVPGGAFIASLIDRALARGGMTARDVDYVNAHGTGTPVNDHTEAAALVRALGSQGKRIPVSSSKGQIGHTLGAAGAIEAVITSLVVARRTLVPTAGLDEPDPALELTHVPHVGRQVPRVRAAITNAFGFGGMDTVLVFAEPGLFSDDGRRSPPKASVPGPRTSNVAVTGLAVFGPCGLLGLEGCAELTEQRIALDAPVDTDPYLDPVRARRLDGAARLGAVAVERVLAESGAPREGTGLVMGSAFGNVDGSAAFMHRIFEKGPRSASPAEFPSLVPSSPVGHVSIYANLHGPTFATADLLTSGESAIVQAYQLVSGGEAVRVLAGASEPRGDIVERVLSAVFADARASTRLRGSAGGRADLAAVILLEAESEARARGARIVARVEQAIEWRGDGAGALAGLRPPRGRAGLPSEIVLARPADTTDRLIAESAWRASPRRSCSAALGESDGLGAVAMAIAAARIGAGLAGEALVIGAAQGRGYAIVLAAK